MAEWNGVLAAVTAALGADTTEGRRLLMECWEDTVATDHAHRCVLAHYLADVQEDLDAEIRWDETALHEYGFLIDGELAPVGIPSVRGMLPSLHLNLGDGYLRSGQDSRARKHRVIPNPVLAPRDVYVAKTRRWASEWPSLQVLPWPDSPTGDRGASP